MDYKEYMKLREQRNKEMAVSIVDVFEALLDEHSIIIPDTDRPAGNDTPIYGHTYGRLIDDISEMIDRCYA